MPNHRVPVAVTVDAITEKAEAASLDLALAIRKAHDAGLAFTGDTQAIYGRGVEAVFDIRRLAKHAPDTSWDEDKDVLLAAAAVLQRVAARHAARILGIVEDHVDQAVENHGLADAEPNQQAQDAAARATRPRKARTFRVVDGVTVPVF